MTKDTCLQLHSAFLTAEFDNDMVGICLAIINFLKEILKHESEENLYLDDTPPNYRRYLLSFPEWGKRNEFRKLLKLEFQNDDESYAAPTDLQKIAHYFLAYSYLYNMPVPEMVKLAKQIHRDFSREDIAKLLVDNGMSPNLIDTPSGKDYSALLP